MRRGVTSLTGYKRTHASSRIHSWRASAHCPLRVKGEHNRPADHIRPLQLVKADLAR